TGISDSGGGTGGGTIVTIFGSGFYGDPDVDFGGVPASGVTVLDDGTLVATAPSQPSGTVDITVTTAYGTSSTSSADQFTYSNDPGPVVIGVTPDSGPNDGGIIVITG